MKAIGIGRFVRDPELKEIETHNTCVCEFSLAVDERRRTSDGENKKVTYFFDFVIWDKAAEVICEYCKKGDMIYFEATPRQDKWQDQEGNNRSKVIFRVDDFSFLPRAKRDGDKEKQESEKPAF